MKRKTTIEQHQGNRPTGMRLMRLVIIVTECEEGADENTLDQLHAVRVRLAGLDAGARRAATDLITGRSPRDYDDEIGATLAAIAEVTERATRGNSLHHAIVCLAVHRHWKRIDTQVSWG